MTVRLALAVLVLASLPFGTGCARVLGSGVSVNALSVRAAPPGRVLAVVAVSDGDATAEDLSAQNFEVREEEVALDPEAIDLQVNQLGETAGHEAVVLVDGSRAFTAAEAGPLSAGLSQLVDRLRFHQSVTLLVFDGSPDVRFVARYPRSQVAAPLRRDPGIARLLTQRPRDNSSSLFTAIVHGRRLLDAQLAASTTSLPLGSLIVVARGPDLAGRADEAAARAALRGQRSFLLKVGTWSRDDTSIDWIGADGVRNAASLGTLGTPVDELARRVDEVFLRRYVVAYCSPARAGRRTVELVVKFESEDGAVRSGRATTEFDATGFDGSCRASL